MLERFAGQHDEDAFAVLVHRYGPLVLGVCRSVLRDAHDAEDAFQATFLVLVRKAGTLGRPHLLANWLHGVARRTALAAKTQSARRHARERQFVDKRVTSQALGDPDVAAIWADLRPVLDEEIGHLPEKYRAPFILCYLEGRTNEEAARLIGCPKGTVLSRLSWARVRLRARLTRRGLAPTAAVLAAVLSTGVVRAAVSPALARGTVELAMAFAGVSASVGSLGVVSLANGVLNHMFWTKAFYAAAFLVVVSLIGGAGLLALGPPADGPPGGDAPKKAPQAQNQQRKGPEEKSNEKKESAVKEVRVVQPLVREITPHEDFSGRTEPAATVQLRSRVSGYLVKVNVKEGDVVKKGDVLFQIDPRVYQAELDRADAVVAQSASRVQRAENDRKRAETLAGKNAVSAEEVGQAAGRVAEAQAELRVAQASRELAKLNLSFTQIAAPIDGTIGRRPLDAGNLVKADDAVLTTIFRSNPTVVNCVIDERTALNLRRALGAGKPDAKDWASVPVAVGLVGEKGYPFEGKIESAAAQLDSTFGTLRLRTVFANPDGLMIGTFCKIRLTTGKPYKALLVPRRAVYARADGPPNVKYVVLVLNSKNVLEERVVKLGASEDGFVDVK
ncbi:MAG TPA: efflux RND transporter periplasmic adaptor subunit, partial [Pirellulales bacterium]|nr:efflux RND transporter periplasmic adaptor subunit [Pirellulales bacterium]